MSVDIKKYDPVTAAKEACLARHQVEKVTQEEEVKKAKKNKAPKDPDLGKTGDAKSDGEKS